jgi:phage-related protein
MARWVWSHTSSAETSAPAVRLVRFGDGYEQRAPAGLNHQLRSWQVRCERCEPRVWGDMLAFLRARAGVEAFDWTTNEDIPVRVVCETWQPEHVRIRGLHRVNVTMTFREVVA